MQHLTLRASSDLIERLDALREARGLSSRAAALRVAIREVSPTSPTRAALPGREELLRLLSERARDGSVPAMRALFEEFRKGKG
jgi:hypothetical protein